MQSIGDLFENIRVADTKIVCFEELRAMIGDFELEWEKDRLFSGTLDCILKRENALPMGHGQISKDVDEDAMRHAATAFLNRITKPGS